MLEGILSVLDGEQLFECLVDGILSTRPTEPSPVQSITLGKTFRPPLIADSLLLKKLVPPELYKEALQSRLMGMHALSFALRHRVTQLQMIFHEAARPGSLDVDPGFRQHLIELWRQRGYHEHWPVFGFSALGIHAAIRPVAHCRAFDAFSIFHCDQKTTELFCPGHSKERFWNIDKPASNQAVMFAFYATLTNFALYGETDLERMTQDFWNSVKRLRATERQSLIEPLQQFGWTNEQELSRAGVVELRRRFLQLSLQHHPDRGGEDQAFIQLQSHYRQLKNFLEFIS